MHSPLLEPEPEEYPKLAYACAEKASPTDSGHESPVIYRGGPT